MVENKLLELYKNYIETDTGSITKLPGSGSYRTYYRIQGKEGTVIGVHNEDDRDNEAFISFTRQFRIAGLPVPEVLATDLANGIYLLSDLGDTTLFQLLSEKRSSADSFPPEIVEIYKKAIGWLPIFQVKAGKGLDYSVCYPRAAFDRQSMLWDLNYFKYYFLKLAKVPFDEQALEDDFNTFTEFLVSADSEFFLFRDFQSRNIMVLDGEPWFIDYQGGRKGALQYDVASLLTDAKADIPMEVRKELLYFYLNKLDEIYPVNREKFLASYYGFALIRILQALGAYGFRGYYENKPHFLQSIPFALRNLRYLREKSKIGFGLDTLMGVIDKMIEKPEFYQHHQAGSKLTVTILSFSYRNPLPADVSGNGGGFVFDCRALPNPGRFDEYKPLSGKDQPVIGFLKKESSVDEFLNHACSLVDQSVKNYIDRGFENLMVSFGCTGGQHRSVYCAEELAKYLSSKYKIKIVLNHSNIE